MMNEPASPVCYAAEADDLYMGYAPREEIIAALNILLEAERAGAKVALASMKVKDDPEYAALMRTVRADEARWCAMLSQQIKQLGGKASPKTGDFLQKALAIADPLARLAFLNRGQSWVVRALEDLIRRVRDDELNHALRAMLESHRENIRKADVLINAEQSAP